MAEYIKLEVAVKAFNNFDAGRADSPPCTLLTPEEFAEYLYEIPAADVSPVVRCENCTSGIMSDDNKYIICCRLGVGMELDDFCSYGARKNGDGGHAAD